MATATENDLTMIMFNVYLQWHGVTIVHQVNLDLQALLDDSRFQRPDWQSNAIVSDKFSSPNDK